MTNGERWTLVYAESDKPTGTAEWRAELWFEERLTLRAFRDSASRVVCEAFQVVPGGRWSGS